MTSERLPRKLVAVLYADVAGYSRLTAKDEDATHRGLGEHLDLLASIIAEHDGRVMHYAGDAVLAMFGAVADALTCAMRAQQELAIRNSDLPVDRRIEFRIGVNLGDVIEDRSDIYGDGVNIAARLETLAEAGGVCVSESVRTAVAGKLPLTFEDLGTRRLKNIDSPVRAFRVHAGPAARSGPLSLRRWRAHVGKRRWELLAAALGLLAVYALVAGRFMAGQAPLELGDRRSIAVLPFENRSALPEDEFFVGGIHDEILTQLAKISALKVISRTSVMEYGDRMRNLRDIGEALGVATILEGAVQRAGDTVQITVQLIDARTDAHIWAESYNRELSAANLFAIQTDMAAAIAAALEATLTNDDVARISEVPTRDTRAYDFYLSGREYERRAGLLGSRQLAVQQYERAVAADPAFALAWARLSLAHITMYWFRYDPTAARRELALAAVQTASRLQADLAEAHFAMAHYHYYAFRDYEEALRSLALAERGMPGDAELLAARSYLYRRLGRWDDALAHLERGIQLDPKSSALIGEHALTYLTRRDYGPAAMLLERALELAPDSINAYTYRAFLPLYRNGDLTSLERAANDPLIDTDRRLYYAWTAAIRGRDYDAALAHLDGMATDLIMDTRINYLPKASAHGVTLRLAGRPEQAAPRFAAAFELIQAALDENPDDPRLLIAAGEALAGLGRTEEAVAAARRALDLVPSSRDAFDGPVFLLDAALRVFLPADAGDSAIEALDAYLAGSGNWSIEGFLSDPALDPVRADPRFEALVRTYARGQRQARTRSAAAGRTL